MANLDESALRSTLIQLWNAADPSHTKDLLAPLVFSSIGTLHSRRAPSPEKMVHSQVRSTSNPTAQFENRGGQENNAYLEANPSDRGKVNSALSGCHILTILPRGSDLPDGGAATEQGQNSTFENDDELARAENGTETSEEERNPAKRRYTKKEKEKWALHATRDQAVTSGNNTKGFQDGVEGTSGARV